MHHEFQVVSLQFVPNKSQLVFLEHEIGKCVHIACKVNTSRSEIMQFNGE